MKIEVCSDYEAMSKKACGITSDLIKKNKKAFISFPCGDTPALFMDLFSEEVNDKKTDISEAAFISLDEWVGLGEKDEGSCAHFLNAHLFGKLKYNFANKFILNGANKNIEEELRNHEDFFNKYAPLNLSVLGIGLNGHIGFNESGVDISLNSHIIDLDNVTKKVMVKYFGNNFKPTRGITQGINQIMGAETIIVMASGKHKADVVNLVVNGKASNEVPASLLQNHKNCFLILDKDAASNL